MAIKHIVIINGSGGVGKDTFVNFVDNYISAYTISSVTEIKDVARRLGWTGSKTEKDRKFLSDLKILSGEYNDFPFNELVKGIDEFVSDPGRKGLVFLMIREPNEIQRVKDYIENDIHGTCVTLLITNNNVNAITSNVADAGVNNYEYDYTVNNNGTLEDLEKESLTFVMWLNKNDPGIVVPNRRRY